MPPFSLWRYPQAHINWKAFTSHCAAESEPDVAGFSNLRGLLSLPKASTHAAITNTRIIAGFFYWDLCFLWSLTTFPSLSTARGSISLPSTAMLTLLPPIISFPPLTVLLEISYFQKSSLCTFTLQSLPWILCPHITCYFVRIKNSVR